VAAEANSSLTTTVREMQSIILRFQEHQDLRGEDFESARREATELRQQLAVARKDRNNVLHTMVEEVLELQRRNESLAREKQALVDRLSNGNAHMPVSPPPCLSNTGSNMAGHAPVRSASAELAGRGGNSLVEAVDLDVVALRRKLRLRDMENKILKRQLDAMRRRYGVSDVEGSL